MQGLAVGQVQDLDPPTGTFAHVKAPLPDNDAERLVEFARTAARAGVIWAQLRARIKTGFEKRYIYAYR